MKAGNILFRDPCDRMKIQQNVLARQRREIVCLSRNENMLQRADRNKSSTCHWGKLLLWGLMEPISLHLHALSQSHCVFFISKNRLIYCFRLPNCRQLFPVLSCFYSCGYATHCTVVFREIYPPTNFNFRFHLMIACLKLLMYLSKALQILPHSKRR